MQECEAIIQSLSQYKGPDYAPTYDSDFSNQPESSSLTEILRS